MNKKQIRLKNLCFFGSILLTSFLNGQNEPRDWYAGAQLGSMGVGAQLQTAINDKMNARVAFSFMQLKPEKEMQSGDISFEKKSLFRTGGVGLTVDWQFYQKWEKIRITGGLYYQFNRVNQERIYTFSNDGLVEDMGSLKIEIYTFPLNPCIGLQWGKLDSNRKFNYLIDAGFLFHGRPKVNFTGSGRVEPTAEQDEIVQNNLKNYNFYPNLNFTLLYTLNHEK